MTDEKIAQEKARIDSMSRLEMCRLWRFAPVGHPYFVSGSPLCNHFEARMKELGGFTSAISKALG